MVLTPSGKRVPIEDEGSDVVELNEQGFYELRGENNNVTVVAVNVEPRRPISRRWIQRKSRRRGRPVRIRRWWNRLGCAAHAGGEGEKSAVVVVSASSPASCCWLRIR
jgi:hypothetical protein